MTEINKLLLTLGCLVTYSGQAQTFNTQEGSVVTYAGDTLLGLIKEQSDLSEQIQFQPRRSATFQMYTPSVWS